MKVFHLAIILFLMAVSVSLAGCTSTVADPKITEMKGVAHQLTISINNDLSELKAGIQNNSRVLASAGLSGPGAEAALAENLMHHPWAVSSVIISRDGIVTTAVPKNHAGMVGKNLSWQPQVQKANTDQVPVVSGVFRMEEGFTGISQSYPVFSSSGEYLGYTDITYPADAFLGRQIEPVIRSTGYDVWVTQLDGTEIFDTTKEEIGKNIVTDTIYADPAIQEFVARIIKEPSGTANYVFWDKEWNRNVTKTAVWETAGIDGATWRVVVTSADSDNAVKTTKVPATAAVAADARYANLTRFVKSAHAYAQEHGKEAALREFNNVNGTFIDGDLYVFAYTMNGTVIALPYQQGLLGTDRTGVADANGVTFIDRMIEVARDGGGSVYYIYLNPGDNFQEEFKLSYVLPVDNEWFVGAGIYLPELPAGFNITERDELVLRVKLARGYAHEQGAGRAIADFNDRNGTFADGSRYIFAYANNGTTLALPFQPELIGLNRLNFADTHGVKIIEWEISAAKRGGGFVYVDYLNPDTGLPGLKLCYVTPVDDTWLVGSGIYADRQ